MSAHAWVSVRKSKTVRCTLIYYGGGVLGKRNRGMLGSRE